MNKGKAKGFHEDEREILWFEDRIYMPNDPEIRIRSGYDSIWVVVDCLTKVANFIPVKTTYTSAKLAKIYMTRIVCLHGVPRTIVSDRGT